MQRKLIPEKAESLEFQVKDHLNKCGAVVLTYGLWMSRKNEEIFSMTAHHCEELDRGFFHIFMPATTGTDGKSLANVMNGIVKTFGLEKYCRIHLQRRYKLG